MEPTLSKISDKDLHQEYIKRFTLPTGDIVSSSKQVVLHLRPYFAKEPDREKLVVVYLSSRNGLIGTELLFTGTLSSSQIYIRALKWYNFQNGPATVAFSSCKFEYG